MCDSHWVGDALQCPFTVLFGVRVSPQPDVGVRGAARSRKGQAALGSGGGHRR